MPDAAPGSGALGASADIAALAACPLRSLVDYARSLIGIEYFEGDVKLGTIEWATLEDHHVVVWVEPGGCCGDRFEAVVDEICYRENWPYGPILHPIKEMVLLEEVLI